MCIVQMPTLAETTSVDNRIRCQIAGDLLVFSWSLYPIVQVFPILGLLPSDRHLMIMSALDLLSKLGVSHIMLKSRAAISHCSRHAAEEPIRLQ